MFPAVYNANTRIVQGPGRRDYLRDDPRNAHHPADGRDHIASNIRRYHGDSRGRWDGDTLVVDVRNFNDMVNYRGRPEPASRRALHARWPNDLRYEVTVEDATTFAKSWTAALNLKTQPDEMFEYACHEGNHAMFNMLSAGAAEGEDFGIGIDQIRKVSGSRTRRYCLSTTTRPFLHMQ